MTAKPPSIPADGTASSSASDQATAVDALLDQHMEALRAQFPLPDLEELARRAQRRRRRSRTAAATLGVCALAGALWWADPALRHASYAAGAHTISQVTLPDGSQAVLDAGARLRVDWHLRSRRVTLDEGRAAFDVEHAAWRPFHVDAGSARVRVLGTVFSVARDTDSATVTVAQGRVQVRADGEPQPRELAANQTVQVRAGRFSTTGDVPAEDALAWRKGVLVLDDVSLAEAIERIQPYRAAPIRLAAGAPVGLRVSGVFALDQPDALLDLLPRIGSVTVRQTADGTAWIEPR
ncbi:hypothetical protein FOZ76_15490 [Verticiella sediminum]|uniref:FecR protein domain-containing protein n=1 Tax=Verticiella sediminum TaxID=1247510 RepID=A0A556AIS2_9BURK|nr:FecR domain-containing protein [Verticiella sediminum]TSH92804.1 hypothetical protein FOZ76_15490 [Verticiella sediminum]